MDWLLRAIEVCMHKAKKSESPFGGGAFGGVPVEPVALCNVCCSASQGDWLGGGSPGLDNASATRDWPCADKFGTAALF